ncbi:FAD dependent oxidoreductase [Pseudomassariella vexata]|uniref:FAD dependent oxidoreductase n=1 Tax=Pseudomassariella vexata TaxID=1141098 RepID=A0A1Y2EHT9_9PEZI|nr:FAD dependent oxidoreductase [Pseudomassariella vexata]ORY71140.1 FAD dependent oxidoreductase [Pseudomassariella vexata]
MDPHRPRHVVIVGGGIIGSTTAYFLTRHPAFNPAIHRITLLEASSIAAGASGKAGGLLALWAYPQCLVPLSYSLHTKLAAEHGGAERWGYRRVECGQLTATVVKSKKLPSGGTLKKQETPAKDGQDWQKLPKQDQAAAKLLQESALPFDLDWINGSLVREYAEMGMPGHTETAQVHPHQFTTSIAALAQERGVDIKLNARVTKLGLSPMKEEVEAVEYLDRISNETETIKGVTDIVVAAGPWTGRLLPKTSIEGLRAHSVVFQANVSPYAVFTNITLPKDWKPAHRDKKRHKGNVDPEIYARPGNEVYACGEPDSTIPLPETADEVECDESQCDDLISYIGTVSPVLGAAPIAAKQACYLPRHIRFGDERGPLIGELNVKGLFVASGHTCWGIQNGPATGKLMSEFIFDGEATSADISVLDPKKFKVGV